MLDPQSQVNPALLAAIRSATTEVEAAAVHAQIVDNVPANEDDIVETLRLHFGGGRLRSRKFWLSIIGAVLPIGLQLATGAVTWPVAAGIAGASLVTWVLSQAGIEKSQASALGQAAANAIQAKVAKR